MLELITYPLELNRTVSFSKMSTKISFLDFFLFSVWEMGRWMAVDGMVFWLKIEGLNPGPFPDWPCTEMASFTMYSLMDSEVTSWG